MSQKSDDKKNALVDKATEEKSIPSTNLVFKQNILLPDEDDQEYNALEEAYFEEFAPETTYQSLLVQNLVDIEWDHLRHRRLLAAVVKTSYAKHAEGVYDKGEPVLVLGGYSSRPERQIFLDAIKSDNDKDRRSADKVLKEKRVTRPEISAAAMSHTRFAVAYHEQRIADLEKRRRALLADYDALRTRRKPAPIIEAEVVEDA